MDNQLAQGLIIQPSVGPGTPMATPLVVTGPLKNINNLGDLVNVLMGFIVPIAGVLLFFIIIWGGYDILLSQGNPEKLEGGKQKITAGIIGMVLLVMSYLITRLIGYIFGVDQGFF